MLLPERVKIGCGFHFIEQRLTRNRFADPISNAFLDDAVEKHRIGCSAQHDDGNARVLFSEPFDEFLPVHVRHFEVTQEGGHLVGQRVGGHQIQGGFAVRRGQDMIAFPRKDKTGRIPDTGVVIDDQNSRRHRVDLLDQGDGPAP